MSILNRFFNSRQARENREAADWTTLPSHQGSELVVVDDETTRLSIEFDIDALIVSHERWLPWIAQALTGQADEQLQPAVVLDERSSELGRWLHEVGYRTLGQFPAYEMLVARNRLFHQKASDMLTFAAAGDKMQAEQAFKICQHASRQAVLLLKELKRLVVRSQPRTAVRSQAAARAV